MLSVNNINRNYAAGEDEGGSEQNEAKYKQGGKWGPHEAVKDIPFFHSFS